jgi:uncharacterized protein YcbK (DUF882 family)
MRHLAGDKPIKITSGYRSPAYNATVKGAAKNSQHMYGKAADIFIQGLTPAQMAVLAQKAGFDFIKSDYPNRIHVDVRNTKEKDIPYKKNSK